MTIFAQAIQHLLRPGVEGPGNSDHPNDKGGPTRQGVTQATYDGWRAAHHLPPRHVFRMEDAERDDIYLHDYWQAGRCDLISEVSPRLSLCHFDACVNHGIRRVRKDGRIVGANVMLQELVGVKQDGWVGPGTLATIRDLLEHGGEASLVAGYLELRRKRFASIIAADPSQAVFRKGWARRIDLLEEDARGLDHAA